MQTSRVPLVAFLAFFVIEWLCLTGFAQEEAGDIATDIETIISGGYWKQGQEEGHFRLILKLEGWEHLANRAFLQWVKQGNERGASVVLKSVPIREINNAHWRITGPRLTLNGKSWTLSLNAQATFGEEARVFNIVPTAEFEYAFSEVRPTPQR
jgi:hypothetical protein